MTKRESKYHNDKKLIKYATESQNQLWVVVEKKEYDWVNGGVRTLVTARRHVIRHTK